MFRLAGTELTLLIIGLTAERQQQSTVLYTDCTTVVCCTTHRPTTNWQKKIKLPCDPSDNCCIYYYFVFECVGYNLWDDHNISSVLAVTWQLRTQLWARAPLSLTFRHRLGPGPGLTLPPSDQLSDVCITRRVSRRRDEVYSAAGNKLGFIWCKQGSVSCDVI